METIHKERFIEMANHLLYGELGHKEFNYNTVNSCMPYECGTAGCAMGEMPIIWSESWKFSEISISHVDGMSLLEWFGVSGDEARHLFLAYCQVPDKHGGEHLDRKAKKEQVANNIFAFLKKKDPTFEIKKPEIKTKWDLKLVMAKPQEININAN